MIEGMKESGRLLRSVHENLSKIIVPGITTLEIDSFVEKYLEEPNIWNTWNKIYLEVKPMLDNLVDEDAMSEYTWMGDQDANSYNDLSVNNEADVRQGKYKAILKFKDIVPMQEITMGIYIDQASKSVSVQDVNE